MCVCSRTKSTASHSQKLYTWSFLQPVLSGCQHGRTLMSHTSVRVHISQLLGANWIEKSHSLIVNKIIHIFHSIITDFSSGLINCWKYMKSLHHNEEFIFLVFQRCVLCVFLIFSAIVLKCSTLRKLIFYTCIIIIILYILSNNFWDFVHNLLLSYTGSTLSITK